MSKHPAKLRALPLLSDSATRTSLIISAVALLGFISLAFILPTKDSLLNQLFPKPKTHAAILDPSPDDWPMYQGNAQHTGATTNTFTPVMGSANCQLTSTQDISPCIQARWKKSYTEWPSGQAQAVVSGTTVLVANMDGTLNAYNTDTGASLWTYNAGSAIAVTPAIYSGVAYFGDFNGKIHAISLADKSDVFPAIQTGGPIYSSPVAVNNNGTVQVYIGSNDGKLYAFNGSTGQSLFTYDTGGSAIYSNPAYYNGKVFFAAENMYAYALNANTGQEVWKHQLDGESNRGDHPIVVAATNQVLFHSVPRYGGTGRGLKNLGMDYNLSGVDGNPPKTLDQIMPTYQTNYSSQPGRKSEYLFNADTGAERTAFTVGSASLSTIALNIWYANGQNMPLVQNQNIIFGAFGGLVKLDTSTGIFTTLATYQFVRGDEFTGMTLSNSQIFGGYMSNMASLDLSGATRQQLHGCKDCGDPPPYQPFDTPLASNHWAGYTGDGYTDLGSFPIIAHGHMYYVSEGWLYAF